MSIQTGSKFFTCIYYLTKNLLKEVNFGSSSWTLTLITPHVNATVFLFNSLLVVFSLSGLNSSLSRLLYDALYTII